MSEFGVIVWCVLGLLALALIVLVLLGVRRSQLRRTLGTFDASLRVGEGRWSSGVCRYADHSLEFLRWLSLTPVAAYRFERTGLELKGWRQPTDAERPRLASDAILVELDSPQGPLQLGMSYGAYTGLSAWIEAGPVAGVGTWRQAP
ncbi:DUF2550 domain-containing protein [Galactobacter valiniphilus]|uniref:DUF2550 family protein n=1 Tax=Galactobacter valiniphilus TaxID=2676122 RepID=A0A399JC81_9MICC|nr:DUF2550 domain-containing protein [Galactobacter valiniphilus]RII42680.1 DUF2550 family protein [Galactobacter valiniphilus]